MNAVIFDLDDTLYRERRWLVSGFGAVARHLEVAHRADRRQVLRCLVASLRAGHRHDAFQRLCQRFGLSEALIPGFVKLVRTHRPALTLCRSTRSVLARLRSDWRIGVLTNGMPAVQERKAAALGVRELVDTLVYASNHGGKPEPEPFLEVARRIRVEPARCVFVGDDPWCDVFGARQVGMRTVRIRRPGKGPSDGAGEADAVIDDLVEVAEVARRLLATGSERHDDNDDLRACG